MLKEGPRASGAHLRIDTTAGERLYREWKAMPVVAGVSLRTERRDAFRRVMDSGAGATRYVMAAIAAVITFGIVYNSARIAFAERALPLGSLLGYGFSLAVAAGFSTDLYQVPVAFEPAGHGVAALAVLAAAVMSGALVRRDINRLDLVSALKTRE